MMCDVTGCGAGGFGFGTRLWLEFGEGDRGLFARCVEASLCFGVLRTDSDIVEESNKQRRRRRRIPELICMTLIVSSSYADTTTHASDNLFRNMDVYVYMVQS